MLTERDRRILRTVIDAYVADGVPVSSGRVQDTGGYSMSTATIRNRLAALERDGYLMKTHVSSGRVPTDDGYRVYVNDLRANQSEWGEVTARCRRSLRAETHGVGEIMNEASHLLGRLSRNLGVVYGAVEQESHVRAVKLVRLAADRVLVVAHIEPDYERTRTLRFDRDFSHDAVVRSEKLLDDMVSGRTLEEARAALASAVRDNVTDEGVITREVAIQRESIFTEPPAVELYFEERSHLLEQPELMDPKNLQMILRLLHNKTYLTSILSARSSERTQVTIGAEHADEALRPFSVVTAGYRMGAARGVLGIIGPTRMRYDLVLALVETVSRELRAIGEEYF